MPQRLALNHQLLPDQHLCHHTPDQLPRQQHQTTPPKDQFRLAIDCINWEILRDKGRKRCSCSPLKPMAVLLLMLLLSQPARLWEKRRLLSFRATHKGPSLESSWCSQRTRLRHIQKTIWLYYFTYSFTTRTGCSCVSCAAEEARSMTAPQQEGQFLFHKMAAPTLTISHGYRHVLRGSSAEERFRMKGINLDIIHEGRGPF